jgi:hypothetical protein
VGSTSTHKCGEVAQAARPELVEHGWRQFLVKVHNRPARRRPSRDQQPGGGSRAMPDELRNLWLDLQMFDNQPLTKTLSGLVSNARIVQLYAGSRSTRRRR